MEPGHAVCVNCGHEGVCYVDPEMHCTESYECGQRLKARAEAAEKALAEREPMWRADSIRRQETIDECDATNQVLVKALRYTGYAEKTLTNLPAATKRQLAINEAKDEVVKAAPAVYQVADSLVGSCNCEGFPWHSHDAPCPLGRLHRALAAYDALLKEEP